MQYDASDLMTTTQITLSLDIPLKLPLKTIKGCKNICIRFTERDNLVLHLYQSYYLIIQTFYLLKRKERKHIGFYNGLKAFIKNVENTENQIASRKQKADIHYKKWNPILPLM